MSEKETDTKTIAKTSQGKGPILGTIQHRDPETAVGTSPGTVRSIMKGATDSLSGGSTQFKHDTTTVTKPSGSQPMPSGMPATTKRLSHLQRLRLREGR